MQSVISSTKAEAPSGRPQVFLKFARSFDGCLDDSSETRVVFSGAEDKAAVQKLRAEYQAILIGAETLRRDNPSLLSQAPAKNPVKVTLSRSGRIDLQSRFFQDGSAPKLVYCTFSAEKILRDSLQGKAEVIALGEREVAVEDLLTDLSQRGINSLLLEGGPKTITQFLEKDLIDSFRIAVSSKMILEKEAPRILSTNSGRFQFTSLERLDDLLILNGTRKKIPSSELTSS